MERKPGLSGTSLVGPIAAILLAALGFWACRTQAAECDICGRHEFSALAFRIEYTDGGEVTTCCPRCASHAAAMHPDRSIARLIAHDFVTGKEMDARSAVYVDGSDFEHCTAPKERRTTPGSLTTLAYDRCLPSLIAFGSRQDAEAFAKEHGGTIRSFEELDFGKK